MRSRLAGFRWENPGKALLYLPELFDSLLCDGKRLDKHGDVAECVRHWIDIALIFDDKFRHEAVPAQDSAFGVLSGVAEILTAAETGETGRHIARASHCGNGKIAQLRARDLRAGFDDFSQRFMPDYQIRRAIRRRAVLKIDNLFIRATDTDVKYAKLNLCWRRQLGLGMIRDGKAAIRGENGDSFHLGSILTI